MVPATGVVAVVVAAGAGTVVVDVVDGAAVEAGVVVAAGEPVDVNCDPPGEMVCTPTATKGENFTVHGSEVFSSPLMFT